jgi:hypothetical protein
VGPLLGIDRGVDAALRLTFARSTASKALLCGDTTPGESIFTCDTAAIWLTANGQSLIIPEGRAFKSNFCSCAADLSDLG